MNLKLIKYGLPVLAVPAVITALAWNLIEPAAAQVVIPVYPWTAVASTGTIDEATTGKYQFTNATAGYLPAYTLFDPIEFRYNVTNTMHAVGSATGAGGPTINMPGWTQLEFGGIANGTSIAEATLYQVRRCDGAQVAMCTVRITNADIVAGAAVPAGICKRCQIPSTMPVDFGSNLYYVRVMLDRNTAAESPRAHTLRIY